MSGPRAPPKLRIRKYYGNPANKAFHVEKGQRLDALPSNTVPMQQEPPTVEAQRMGIRNRERDGKTSANKNRWGSGRAGATGYLSNQRPKACAVTKRQKGRSSVL
ncbi:uncharacterized protein SPSK_10046 [Sporothrix schenckii 1099-18]|uniref:Uncharacterized protein n=1 Tax=Sporothrix schenckii 1099-18 TaxID=1397361 RepID=A0A0F2MA39_SPOSC|nr:uncharacterized protein SPSK_10046 [Sporothrix schenckii 1099-18]KJR85939.1 hypothetical protein SPSK_10046 [Sporothrix schenckii 1099-18]